MRRLSVSLLGGFQVRLDSGPALALPTRKAQALLAYLAVPPGQAHPRDKLAPLLWGGIREESARASLRQALFAIRKATDPAPALVMEASTVALAPDAIDVDVERFTRAVAEGTPDALARAAELYRGDLLAGFVVDEAPYGGCWARVRGSASSRSPRSRSCSPISGATGPRSPRSRRR
jgi:DNA-binding SARP family transcriptional activator